jgi:hypothetical protein
VSEIDQEENIKKHFTNESKERQREGGRKGGGATKHFTPESKQRQIDGARKGGQHSHMRDEHAEM